VLMSIPSSKLLVGFSSVVSRWVLMTNCDLEEREQLDAWISCMVA
jgi:hypothetical protein